MNENKRITLAGGLVAVVAGIALIGTSGLAFAIGWGLWLVGLVAVLGAVGRTGEAPVATLAPTFEPVSLGERRAA